MAQEIADSKLIDTWGSSGTKIEPDISKIIEGWQLGEQPPHEYMNWLQNTFGSKLNHILKNGIAEWNNETEYLVGASVQYNGNVWLCETANTNSTPTELNENWERLAINKDLTLPVDTLADLKNISYPANTVWASGYHTKNDGAFGSHIFRLKGVKTTETDNSGTVIIATIGGTDYVYELQYDGAVHIKWFGAVGDLDRDTLTGTDDSDAIQAAFDYAASSKSILTDSGNGYALNTHGIILNSGTTFVGSKNTLFSQNYEFAVEPKSESLFRNYAWNSATLTDENISLSSFSICNNVEISGGSSITINKCNNYNISDIYIRKTSENTAMNIGGYGFKLDNITIKNLNTDAGKIDGIHFEYIEDCTMSNLHIHSKDDCLGFAYYPAILPPRSPAEALANVKAGRDLPSRNIVVSNCVLSSEIANGIRVGNWANFQDLNKYMMPDGRYENMTFSNIIINKTGVTGTSILLEDYRHGPLEIAQPSNEIRFNNIIVNDYTSSTESLISIRGNPFLKGFFDYETAGADRNFRNVFFNGISGTHASTGLTYDLNGASSVSMTDCKVRRTVASNHELATQLVNSIRLSNTDIQSVAASTTGNACLFRDFLEVKIEGGTITGNGLEVAGIRVHQPNLGNVGRLLVNGTRINNVVNIIDAVSPVTLLEISTNIHYGLYSGTERGTKLSAIKNDIAQFTSINAKATMSLNEVRRTNNIAVANATLVVTANIIAGQNIATFPLGSTPVNSTAIRHNMINENGGAALIDYSGNVGLRSQTTLSPGIYYLTLSYLVN